MKKLLFLIVATIFSTTAFAQRTDSLGIDNSALLNAQESTFLNIRFEKERGDFDFTNKRVLFFSGSNASTISDKISYFNDVKEWREKYNRDISSNIVFLTIEQKQLCGYDAIVTKWSMVLMSPKKIAKIVTKSSKEKSK